MRQGLSGSAFPEGLSHASGDAPCRSSAKPPPLEGLSPSHGAFQEHAAHVIEWSITLSPKGSLSACTPKAFPHSSMPLTRRTERRLLGVGSSALFGAAGQGVFGFFQASDLPRTPGEVHTRTGLFSGAERKTTHPHLPLCDTNHRPVLKGFAMSGEHTVQRSIHAVGMHIAEAKRDHTGQRGSARGD